MEAAALQASIKTAYEQERWSEVIELVSQTNWQNEALLPFEALALVEALFYMSEFEEFAYTYSKLFVDFYGNVEEKSAFEAVIGKYYVWKGDNEMSEDNFSEAIDFYELALPYLESLSEWIKKVDSKLKTAKKDLKASQEKAEELEIERFKIEVETKARVEKAEAEKAAYLAQTIEDMGGLGKSIVKKLNDNGIVTLGDLSETSDFQLDQIEGIGEVTLSQIKAFKSKNNL